MPPLARARGQEAKMRAVVDSLAQPHGHLRFVTAAEAATIRVAASCGALGTEVM